MKSTNEGVTWRGVYKTNKTKEEIYFICKEGIFIVITDDLQIEFVSLFPMRYINFLSIRERSH